MFFTLSVHDESGLDASNLLFLSGALSTRIGVRQAIFDFLDDTNSSSLLRAPCRTYVLSRESAVFAKFNCHTR